MLKQLILAAVLILPVLMLMLAYLWPRILGPHSDTIDKLVLAKLSLRLGLLLGLGYAALLAQVVAQ